MVDSLKIFDIIKASSLPDEQTRAMTLAIQKAESEIALDVKTVLLEFRAALDQRFDRLDQRFEIYATKADLAQMESRVMRWMIGFWVGQTALIVALKLFVR